MKAMDRQIGTCPVARQTAEGERLWLSMLVGAMEQPSTEECSALVLARLRLQLACPASPFPFGGTAYSLRN
jgi:hypothetical protein